MLDFERDVLPAVKARARVVLQRNPQRVELTNDAVSLAWEAMLTVPDGIDGKAVAFYAVRRAVAGRQFRQSVRSLMGPELNRRNKRDRRKAQQAPMEVGRLLDHRNEDPALLATVKIDFADWIGMLSRRELQFLTAFMAGERTQAVARRMRVSEARVSQIRSELVRYWKLFTS